MNGGRMSQQLEYLYRNQDVYLPEEVDAPVAPFVLSSGADPGSVRVQFEKVLRGQISLIVICLFKAVSIHSGQRGTGGCR